MFLILPLCLLFVTVIALDSKSFDNENAVLVVAAKDIQSHDEARAKCKVLYSELAVMKSPQVLEYIFKLIEEDEYVGKQYSNWTAYVITVFRFFNIEQFNIFYRCALL